MTNRKLYQQRFIRLIKKVQDAYRQAVYNALQSQINYFADNYKQGDTPDFIPKKPVIKALRLIYEASGYNNARYVRQSLKRDIAKAMDTGERLRWMVNEYYRRNLLDQSVAPITDTTKKQILQVLEKANEEGWGVKKTVAALKNSDLTKQRAELIVRTETMRAANAGAMLAAADLGIAVQKEWISAQDNRTRRIPRDQYDHLHMSGRTVGFTDLFIVPSTKSIDAMAFPGDPNGSAGNVCNCRCTVAFVPIRNSQGRAVPVRQNSPSSGDTFVQIAREAVGFAITTGLINALISEIENEES